MTPTPLTPFQSPAGFSALHLVAQVDAHPAGGQRAAGGTPAQGGGGAAQSPLGGLLMPLLMVVVIYFVAIRPMNKQRKEQEELNKGLHTGDQVVTASGIIGKITGLTDTEVTLEVSEKVRVKFRRSAIESKYPPPSAAAAAATGRTETAQK
jgi:preprotein translocase subunit YajC